MKKYIVQLAVLLSAVVPVAAQAVIQYDVNLPYYYKDDLIQMSSPDFVFGQTGTVPSGTDGKYYCTSAIPAGYYATSWTLQSSALEPVTYKTWSGSSVEFTYTDEIFSKLGTKLLSMIVSIKQMSYSVEYVPNGGTISPAPSTGPWKYSLGGKLPTGSVATREGYTLTGWKVGDTSTILKPGASFTGSTLGVTSNNQKITLTAQWTADTYKVTLNKNGGTCEDLTSYTYGVGATLPDATKDGHKFDGWYANASFSGSAVKEISKTDTGNKEFWAKFTADSCTLHLEKGAGIDKIYYKVNGKGYYESTTSSKDVSVDFGTTWYAYATPATGYSYTETSESNPASGVMGTGGAAFSPKGTLGQYDLKLKLGTGIATIYYKVNGASDYTPITADETVKVNYNTTWYAYAKAAEGYTYTATSEASPKTGTMTTEGASFLPEGTICKYSLHLEKGAGIDKIYYKVNGKAYYESTTSSKDVSVDYGTTWYAYAEAATGYSYTETSESNPASGVMGTGGAAFNPKGTLNQYGLKLKLGTGIATIYYKVNGASDYAPITADETVKVNYNTKWYAYATAAEGYTYTATSEASPQIGTMTTEGALFSPTGTARQYVLSLEKGTGIATIYYKVNGATSYTQTTSGKDVSVDFGTTWYAYATPATGYSYTETSESNPTNGVMGTGGAAFSPKGTLGQYDLKLTLGTGIATIYYKINGAKSYTSVTSDTTVKVDYNTTWYAYAKAAEGYTYTATSETKPQSGTMKESGATFAPVADIGGYTLRLEKGTGIASIYYKVNGATSYAKTTSGMDVKVNYNTTWYAYAEAETGYSYTETSETNPASGVMGTEGALFSPKGTLNQYDLKLKLGTGIAKIHYKVNGAADYTPVTSDTTVKVNYNTTWYAYAEAATGYSYTTTSKSNPASGVMTTGGASFSPEGTVCQYNLRLEKGTGIASIYYKVNGAASYAKTTSGMDVKVNYNTTWYAYAEAETGYSTETSVTNPTNGVMGTEGALFSPKGTANEYTLFFDGNGGTVPTGEESKTITYDQPYGEMPTPTWTGHVFNGWFDAITGGNEVKPSDIVKKTDAEQWLYAHWSETPVLRNYVDFDGNGKTSGEMAVQTFTNGIAQALSTNEFAKEGFTFQGWTNETKKAFYTDNEVVTFTDPDGTTNTLKAVWTVNTYTMHFEPNATTVLNPTAQSDISNCVSGAEIKLPACQYINLPSQGFLGWVDKNSVTNQAGTTVTHTVAKSGETVTYKAAWEDNSDLSKAVGLDAVTALTNTATKGTDFYWKVSEEGALKGDTCVCHAFPSSQEMQESKMSMLVKGPGTLTFWYKKNKDVVANDYLALEIDGTKIKPYLSRSAKTTYQACTNKIEDVNVPLHTITWSCWSDGSTTAGRAFYIDDVTWTPEGGKPKPLIFFIR